MKYYSIALEAQVEGIKEAGLNPDLGLDLFPEFSDRILLYTDKDVCDDDLSNNLMDFIDEKYGEDAEVVIITVDLPDDFPVFDDLPKDWPRDEVGYSCYTFCAIPSNYITEIFYDKDQEVEICSKMSVNLSQQQLDKLGIEGKISELSEEYVQEQFDQIISETTPQYCFTVVCRDDYVVNNKLLWSEGAEYNVYTDDFTHFIAESNVSDYHNTPISRGELQKNFSVVKAAPLTQKLLEEYDFKCGKKNNTKNDHDR